VIPKTPGFFVYLNPTENADVDRTKNRQMKSSLISTNWIASKCVKYELASFSTFLTIYFL
jgi:hypothetical protein